MTKQYKLIETMENGEQVSYTFETKKQLREFLAVTDCFNFTVKEEWMGTSI